MVQPRWNFRVMTRGEMNADPIESEFFSTEHLDSVADALVRESIQNSLDAGLPGHRVTVIFRLFTKKSGVKENLSPFIRGLQPHLNAKQNGLVHYPSKDEPGTLLVVEDYGTRGLEGDPEQDDDFQFKNGQKKNDFFYFWRNIGRSKKGAMDRGRWGLGKTVFQATSRINSFFGMTVRESDGRSLLMGQSVLKTHLVKENKHYPYGWFGEFDENLALPIENAEYLKKFSSKLKLDRLGKPGLSIAIPYPDPSIKIKSILSSVLLHYFFPILSKDLVVKLYLDGKRLVIDDKELTDSEKLPKLLEHVDFSRSRMSREEFKHLFDFTRWIHSVKEDDRTMIKPPLFQKAPKWDQALFNPDTLAQLSEKFEKAERLAIRVPLKIKPKDQEPQKTCFDVYLERDERLERAEDHFIREGITIAGVSTLKQKGVRAIISITDKALSGLLGDAENPAHTEWQERTPKFKDCYQHGPSCIRFVKNSPREIVKILSKPVMGIDKKLLEDLFSVVPPSGSGADGFAKGKDTSASGKPVFPSEMMGEAKEFRLLRRKGGFRIVKNPKAKSLPKKLSVEVAYETRRGNPFSKYRPYDFEMNKGSIKIETIGSRIVEQGGNRIQVELQDKDFLIEVTGFDLNRDLRVKADPVREEADD